ncbi:MAG: TCP-1/cpn60 chaperonin family protein [Nanoarchaeota archaeon]|nr:TCP-1/cpn60 chaperonin family protein [Nanoarchaeota archaeon]MBU4352208.1 TCP-1/cpn60 chaperonin family protein [Nanoarchaeota archaeon]MBU4456234.1 TCP-1/cpn60 chaperonin family protein [Nanoarchaeota archaeon]MCG2719370.1 TCP-1/cpn60 chaperonin family protein [Nanoarchaeota archaeon]
MSNQQPIFILPEGTHRTMGKDAQRNNIMAAKLVAETVRTTLGPKGMDKMIVDSLGDITVTNDGVTILNEMQIEHPIAKMLVEVAKTQEEQVGDGTTTAVILAGELLKNAERLLDQEIHPTMIIKGYREAAQKAQEVLNEIAEPLTKDAKELLKMIAITAMTGKGAETAKEKLANLIVNAVIAIEENNKFSMNDIKVEKKVGGSIDESELIQGLVIDKEIVHNSMPNKIENATIALIDSALEVKNTEIDAKIQITDPNQLQSFVEQEEKILKDMVDKIVNSGANAVFCQKGIDDIAQYFLAKAGVMAARRVKKSDMEMLARATGAKMVTKVNELGDDNLGEAGLIEEVEFGTDKMIFIRDCKHPKAVTLLVRGGTQHVVDEVERAVKDAIGDLIASLQVGKVVAGAGAPEIEVAKRLREFANSLSGREQLAVLSFADAMEVIPRTLAENAGLDPIDMLTELKSAHDAGQKWAGLNVFTGKVQDSWQQGIIEPLKIKTQAVKSASEVTELILRIDDVIAGSGSKNPMPGGMHDMGGMGGMSPY